MKAIFDKNIIIRFKTEVKYFFLKTIFLFTFIDESDIM